MNDTAVFGWGVFGDITFGSDSIPVSPQISQTAILGDGVSATFIIPGGIE